MASYLILNLLFMIAVCIALRLTYRRPPRAWFATVLVLILLTAIFDNLIIALDIVNYDPGKLLGIYVGVAPIEDFMYTLLAVVLVPTLWHKLGDSNRVR